MSVLRRVAVVKVQSDVREPYMGENGAGRPYEIVSFLGDGKLYAGSAAVNMVMSGEAVGDALDMLVEGDDYCLVNDLNIAKFKQNNDPVFDTICMLRRGQVVRVVLESEHVIGNQRKIWRDTVTEIDLIADTNRVPRK